MQRPQAQANSWGCRTVQTLRGPSPPQPQDHAIPLANINDPSQIGDFDGLVGLKHIRGGGTGTDSTGMPTPLAYQADMGFGKGKFIDINGIQHSGTFAFV